MTKKTEILIDKDIEERSTASLYIEYLERKEQNLIKYLESLLTGKEEIDKFIKTSVVDLLKKVRSGKYE